MKLINHKALHKTNSLKPTKIFPTILLSFFFLGCSEMENENAKSLDFNGSKTTADLVSSNAAVENSKDSTRKFIRTAELKFKVKNVIQSTSDIEDIASRNGGFVTLSDLNSQINQVNTVAISADSSLETTFYTITNSIILRVPNSNLDITLKEISKNIDYLDFRIIKAEDIALQLLSNSLIQKRVAKNEERLTKAIDEKGKKLNETTSAEETLTSKSEQSDNARISNLSLTDQVNFSTVKMSIYQRQAVKRELISNYKNIEEYEPSLGTKIFESLKQGWNILEIIVVFLAKLWGLFLFLLLAYLVYKKYGHKLNAHR